MHFGHRLQCFATTVLVGLSSVGFAQTCNNRVILTTPDNYFETSENNNDLAYDEVKDLRTNLIWKRCSVGLEWDGTGCHGSAGTYTWSESLELTNWQWRLPNIKELNSLVEKACYEPSINANIFPDSLSDSYWSSSVHPSYGSKALAVLYSRGYNEGIEKLSTGYVRLVRNE